MKYSVLLFCFVLLTACHHEKDKSHEEKASSDKPVEGISFSGENLYRKSASASLIAKNDSLIEVIFKKAELDENDYIQAGGLHAAVNRYHDAIEVYSEGLEKFPSSFKLYRHRGHRYLSSRQIDKAIGDLRKGGELVGDDTSVLEYNSAGEPTGSYKYWIWYHIGLYHFFNGAYEQGAEAFENCLSMAIDNKNRAGSSVWLYETYQKMGEADRASRMIESFTADFDIDPEYSYFKKILLYKGLIGPEEMIDQTKPANTWTGTNIARAYGVAIWHTVNNRPEEALKIYNNILEAPHWNTWAYVMTDYEVNVRLKSN